MLGRLAAATAAPTSAGSDDYYTIDDVKEYQIGLWTAIALIAAALSAVVALATMKPEYDSLLYCTFQANVNAPMGKHD